MDTSSILSTAGSSAPASSIQSRSKFTQEEFFKLLTAQLGAQDPLKPMDTQEMLGEIVQLQNLQVTSELSTNFAGMLAQNALTSAGALIGKVVHGTDPGGRDVLGLVDGVSVDQGKVMLQVGNSQVRLENVTEIFPVPSRQTP